MEPFKVLCVNVPDEWEEAKFIYGAPHPEVLEECLVTQTANHSQSGALMYYLQGYDYEGGFIRYHAQNFATLPEQSADEVNEREQEAIIYQR